MCAACGAVDPAAHRARFGLEHAPESPAASSRGPAVPPGMNSYRSGDLVPIFEVCAGPVALSVCAAHFVAAFHSMPLPISRFRRTLPSAEASFSVTWTTASSLSWSRQAIVVQRFDAAVALRTGPPFVLTCVCPCGVAWRVPGGLQECGLIDSRFTMSAVDVAFSKVKPRGERRIGFRAFENVLGLIGTAVVFAVFGGRLRAGVPALLITLDV